MNNDKHDSRIDCDSKHDHDHDDGDDGGRADGGGDDTI